MSKKLQTIQNQVTRQVVKIREEEKEREKEKKQCLSQIYDLNSKRENEFEKLILTIIKSADPCKIGRSYEIFNTGMVDSKRQGISDGNLLIGGQIASQRKTLVMQNDIEICGTDKKVSPNHCQIIYQNIFRNKGYLTQEQQTLLKVRATFNQRGQFYPEEIFKYINKFLQPKQAIYIQDLGSENNTYIRINKNQPILISGTTNFLIGNDAFFTIIDVFHRTSQEKSYHSGALLKAYLDKCNKTNQDIFRFTTQQFEDFMKKIQYFHTLIKNNKEKLDQNDYYYYSVIKFDGTLPHGEVQYALLIQNPKTEQKTTYTFGRTCDASFIYFHNQISRKHCFIKMIDEEWHIIDGDSKKPSSNGIWKGIDERRDKSPKFDNSKCVELEPDQEFRIGCTVCKFDYTYINDFKKPQMNQQITDQIKCFFV